MAAIPIAALALLFIRSAWVRLVFPYLLIAAGLLWVDIAIDFIVMRLALGIPWFKLAIILGTVSVLTAASALVFSVKRFKIIYSSHMKSATHSAVAFALTSCILVFVNIKVSMPMLLLERFIVGGGWFEIFIISVYAAWIAQKMANVAASAAWRRKIWLGFSLVFFGQALLGIAGIDSMLMTGELHVPVPAVIITGPIFRGDGFFMPILFVSTLILTGPAWCSHLCYFGAFDQLAADSKKRPAALPGWVWTARIIIFAINVIAAVGLRFWGASYTFAGVAMLIFGGLGLGTMLALSRRLGVMIHCTVICPVGLIANHLGKLSPFRVRFKDACDGCGACSSICKYKALTSNDIKARIVGQTCTLCGDCIGKCKTAQLEYSFAGLGGPKARSAFIVIIVSLHAIFLALARI